MEKQALNDEMKKHKKDDFKFYPELSGASDPSLIKKRIEELKGAIKALSKEPDTYEKEIKNLQSYVDLFERMIGKEKDEGTEKKANQLNTMNFQKKKENEGSYLADAIGDKGFAAKMTKNYKPKGGAFPKIASKDIEAMDIEEIRHSDFIKAGEALMKEWHGDKNAKKLSELVKKYSESRKDMRDSGYDITEPEGFSLHAIQKYIEENA